MSEGNEPKEIVPTKDNAMAPSGDKVLPLNEQGSLNLDGLTDEQIQAIQDKARGNGNRDRRQRKKDRRRRAGPGRKP